MWAALVILAFCAVLIAAQGKPCELVTVAGANSLSLPRSSTGDDCLGKLSIGVDNVVVCPANCSVANASVLWCLNPPGQCWRSKSGETVEYFDSTTDLDVNEMGELIVSRIPSGKVVNTNCTYLLGNDTICDPVSFEMTQKIGK